MSLIISATSGAPTSSTLTTTKTTRLDGGQDFTYTEAEYFSLTSVPAGDQEVKPGWYYTEVSASTISDSSSTAPTSSSNPTINSNPSTKSTSSSTSSSDATTTPTSVATSISTPTSTAIPVVSKGVSGGAAGGIAIGCILAGIVLGFLAALLFFRRKQQQQQQQHPPVAYVSATEPKNPILATPPDDTLQLNQFLALATPDKELSSELRSLGDLLQAHVENNYHSQPVQASPQALSQALANLGVGSNGGLLSPEELAGLALDPRTRHTAIRHVLAQVIFTSIDFSSKSRLTMLPAPIAAFLQSIPPVERIGGNKNAMNLALSRWRTIGAFLLNPTRSQRNTLVPSEAAIAPQANGVVNVLNSFLAPFVPVDLKHQQANHLQDVILECTKFGYTLLSQPGDWRLNLSAVPKTGYRMAVVCAGLDKLTTNEGQPYRTPNSVAAPVVVQV